MKRDCSRLSDRTTCRLCLADNCERPLDLLGLAAGGSSKLAEEFLCENDSRTQSATASILLLAAAIELRAVLMSDVDASVSSSMSGSGSGICSLCTAASLIRRHFCIVYRVAQTKLSTAELTSLNKLY